MVFYTEQWLTLVLPLMDTAHLGILKSILGIPFHCQTPTNLLSFWIMCPTQSDKFLMFKAFADAHGVRSHVILCRVTLLRQALGIGDVSGQKSALMSHMLSAFIDLMCQTHG